jgi:hypothetical protein
MSKPKQLGMDGGKSTRIFIRKRAVQSSLLFYIMPLFLHDVPTILP